MQGRAGHDSARGRLRSRARNCPRVANPRGSPFSPFAGPWRTSRVSTWVETPGHRCRKANLAISGCRRRLTCGVQRLDNREESLRKSSPGLGRLDNVSRCIYWESGFLLRPPFFPRKTHTPAQRFDQPFAGYFATRRTRYGCRSQDVSLNRRQSGPVPLGRPFQAGGGAGPRARGRGAAGGCAGRGGPRRCMPPPARRCT